MPVIKCMVSRVYCGPKFEKHRLHKDETMTIEPGQVSFFKKLIASKAVILLDDSIASADEPIQAKEESRPFQTDTNKAIDKVVEDMSNEPILIDPTVKGIVMPSINPNTNLKKNKKYKHKKKHK